MLPSYTELKKDNFTFSKLTTPLISPVQVIQQSQPVFAAQANFVEGGMLLTVANHHSVSDGGGRDSILETWAHNTSAAASGSQSFSKYDPVSNDRTLMNEGIPTENIADFPEYVIMPTPPADQTQMAPPTFQMPPMSARIFTFSPECLAELKTAAKAYSTNDAIVGFFWHHMTAARNPTIDPTEEKTSAALFAVNIRGRTSPPLPQSYLGNAIFGGITPRLSISTLTSPATGLIAASAALRQGLNSTHKPSRVPRTIGLLSSRSNPQDFKFAARGFLGPDITVSSWANMGVRQREWGVLGKPEGLRIPYEAADGVVTVFPRLEDGGLEVMCGLETGAMERLVGNPEFLKFAV